MSWLFEHVRHLIRPSQRGSAHNEDRLIADFFCRLAPTHYMLVDIGAGDGMTWSNSYSLLTDGWRGLCVEPDGQKFAALARLYAGRGDVGLARLAATPDSVVMMLRSASIPPDFDFLSLDIDGYDYEVLDTVLTTFRPRIVCCEINEKIPPPIRFRVRYRPDYRWDVSHFYGMSLAALHELAKRHGYHVAELEWNNAFLIPQEHGHLICVRPLVQVYADGYSDRPGRRKEFPWNQDVEEWLSMEPVAACEAIRRYFERHTGHFECEIG